MIGNIFELEQKLKSVPFIPGDPNNQQIWQTLMQQHQPAIVAGVLNEKQKEYQAAQAEAQKQQMGGQQPTVIEGLLNSMAAPPPPPPQQPAPAGPPPMGQGVASMGPMGMAPRPPVQMAGGGIVAFRNGGNPYERAATYNDVRGSGWTADSRRIEEALARMTPEERNAAENKSAMALGSLAAFPLGVAGLSYPTGVTISKGILNPGNIERLYTVGGAALKPWVTPAAGIGAAGAAVLGVPGMAAYDYLTKPYTGVDKGPNLAGIDADRIRATEGKAFRQSEDRSAGSSVSSGPTIPDFASFKHAGPTVATDIPQYLKDRASRYERGLDALALSDPRNYMGQLKDMAGNVLSPEQIIEARKKFFPTDEGYAKTEEGIKTSKKELEDYYRKRMEIGLPGGMAGALNKADIRQSAFKGGRGRLDEFSQILGTLGGYVGEQLPAIEKEKMTMENEIRRRESDLEGRRRGEVLDQAKAGFDLYGKAAIEEGKGRKDMAVAAMRLASDDHQTAVRGYGQLLEHGDRMFLGLQQLQLEASRVGILAQNARDGRMTALISDTRQEAGQLLTTILKTQEELKMLGDPNEKNKGQREILGRRMFDLEQRVNQLQQRASSWRDQYAQMHDFSVPAASGIMSVSGQRQLR